MTYVLENAWPSKLEINGMTAGPTELAAETVVLQCDQIVMQPANCARAEQMSAVCLPARRIGT
jgi:hypothetical protein